MDYTTAALLFPAIPLLLLVMGNRFTVCSDWIRKLYDILSGDTINKEQRENILFQINRFNMRVKLLRNAQLFLCVGLFFNLITVFALYAAIPLLAKYLFGLALLAAIAAITLYMRDVFISAKTLDILLGRLRDNP